jgi:putative PIN family toxin of toxin-antitoxin system
VPVRAVLDTNVALSALLWRGTPHRLLESIRRRDDVQLYSSPALLAELADVLSRPSIAKRLALISRSARDVLSDYVEAVEVVEPVAVPRVVPNDADDDHVIAAAIASHADAIISGDADLLSMGSHEGIQIIDAAQALNQIAP